MPWAAVSADGRDLRLLGEAPSLEAQRRALELVSAVPGVRHVVDQIQLRSVSPYRMSLDWQQDALEVAGYMPNEASLQTLLRRLQTPSRTLVQDLSVARGNPAGWSDAVSALVEAINGLDEAKAELLDQRLSVTGWTSSVASRDQVLDALSRIESLGYVLDLDISARVSPYSMRLTKRDQTLEVEGHVPDAQSRRRLAAALMAPFPAGSAQIVLHQASGSPDGWIDLLTELSEELALLSDARITINDRHLRLEGTMASTLERDRLVADLRTYERRGYRMDLDVTASDADAIRCQKRFDELLITPIQFQSGGTEIGAESDELLQALADATRTCPDARITIAGHTDDRGNARANLRLSRRRAEAVGARLRVIGVDEGRIETIGYGSERPLVDNATALGRARNRRIELVVEVN